MWTNEAYYSVLLRDDTELTIRHRIAEHLSYCPLLNRINNVVFYDDLLDSDSPLNQRSGRHLKRRFFLPNGKRVIVHGPVLSPNERPILAIVRRDPMDLGYEINFCHRSVPPIYLVCRRGRLRLGYSKGVQVMLDNDSPRQLTFGNCYNL
jgi:hypothetical protein